MYGIECVPTPSAIARYAAFYYCKVIDISMCNNRGSPLCGSSLARLSFIRLEADIFMISICAIFSVSEVPTP